jgi:hypothetical protein
MGLHSHRMYTCHVFLYRELNVTVNGDSRNKFKTRPNNVQNKRQQGYSLNRDNASLSLLIRDTHWVLLPYIHTHDTKIILSGHSYTLVGMYLPPYPYTCRYESPIGSPVPTKIKHLSYKCQVYPSKYHYKIYSII